MRISDWSSDVCSSDLPYKGAGDAMNDLLAGRVHIYMNNIPSFIAHVGTGAVRPLALAAKKRSELLPDVPTTGEAGLEGMEMGSWYGLVAPDEIGRASGRARVGQYV